VLILQLISGHWLRVGLDLIIGAATYVCRYDQCQSSPE